MTPPSEGEECYWCELGTGEVQPQSAKFLLVVGPRVARCGPFSPGADSQVRIGVVPEVVAEVRHGGTGRPRADARDLLEFGYQLTRRKFPPLRPMLQVRLGRCAQRPALERHADGGELLVVQAQYGLRVWEECVVVAVWATDPMTVSVTEAQVQLPGMWGADDLTDDRGSDGFPQIRCPEPCHRAEPGKRLEQRRNVAHCGFRHHEDVEPRLDVTGGKRTGE